MTTSRNINNFGLATNQSSNRPDTLGDNNYGVGVVLDVILDDTHPMIKVGSNTKIDADRWPSDVTGNIASIQDTDYTWIGRALVRPLASQNITNKDSLVWAYPLESNISEYPLLNEIVILTFYNGKLYYSKKLNCYNWTNNNLNFSINTSISGKQNTELYSDSPFIGKKESIIKAKTKDILKNDTGYKGYAGKYFVANNKIRTVKRFEGDFLIESRHGQSIHMTAYDDNRNNDSGKYSDYIDGGNPMILIRNRQRQLLRPGQKLILNNSPNTAEIEGTIQEKNVGGYIQENINHDGSSIHITSGQTISGWVTTCYKKMFGTGEEVSSFNGKTSFKYPELSGDQIVIQSDRLILSSRYGESFHYSKKRYAVVTDNEYTVDAHDQIVFTTNVKTVINSPAIYLGEYDKTGEPALLGQTTVNFLYDLCNWLLEHTHWYHHSHEDAGKESPSQTQLPVQVKKLIQLRDSLHTLLSRRVFITGGGFAEGQNGKDIKNISSTSATTINIKNGSGVPGGFGGVNYRKND